MNKIVFVVLVIAAFNYLGDTFLVNKGHCPKIAPVTKFKIAKYTGDWYLYERYFKNTTNEESCIKYYFRDLKNNTVEVTKTLIVNGELVTETSRTKMISPGVLKQDADDIIDYMADEKVIIMSTDYTTYAVNFVCLEWPGKEYHYEFAFILTRKTMPTSGVIKKARDAMDKNNIATNVMYSIDQTNCPKLV